MTTRARGRPRVAGPRALEQDAADLKAWRERYGKTQKEAAEELGLSLQQVKAIEQKRSSLTPMLRKLMEALDLLARYDEEGS